MPRPGVRGRLSPLSSAPERNRGGPPSATAQTPCSAGCRLRTLPCCPRRPRSVMSKLCSTLKSKGEKERYKHLNAEFQRIARRDKKAFFSNQRKEIEEKNRMGKTRDLFKKIRDTKGTFHAKMGTIKDRNAMDLTSRRY